MWNCTDFDEKTRLMSQNMESLMFFCHNKTMCVLQLCFAEGEPLKLWGKKNKSTQKKCKPQGSRNDAPNTNVYFCRSTSTDPLFLPDTFHSWVYFTYIWFYCSRWQLHLALLWAMVKREGKKEKVPQMSCCQLQTVLFSAAEHCRALPSPDLPKIAEQQLAPAVVAVDSSPISSPKPPSAGGNCVETRPKAAGQVTPSQQVELAGSGTGCSFHWAGLGPFVGLLTHFCKDGWGKRGLLKLYEYHRLWSCNSNN